jgi:glyoxylase-like metal-dependent hydrolase (beta-lactamase superfamily II)
VIDVHSLRIGDNHSFINYSYIIVNRSTNEALLVDPGWEFEKIQRSLEETSSTLKGILLTHHHADHSRHADGFARLFDVPVYISQVEKEFYSFDCTNLVPFTPDETLFPGNFRILAYHTPGHTKGSSCFLIENYYLFTGDTLFIEGCGICFNDHSAKEMFHSIQKLKANIGMSVIVYPGHCYGVVPGVPFDYLLTQNIYCHLNEVSKFIAFRLRKNQRGLFSFK